MKILNSFDTSRIMEEYTKAVQKHGEEHVLLLRKCNYYRCTRWLIPYVSCFSTLVVFLGILFFHDMISITRIILFKVTSILLWIKFRRTYMKYKLDYAIVSPSGIKTHRQWSIFSEQNKMLPSHQIRSIQSSTWWFLWSLFSYGQVEVTVDGSYAHDDHSTWSSAPCEIIFTHIWLPRKMKEAIIQICMKQQMQQNYL